MPWPVSPIPTTETSKEQQDKKTKSPTENVAEMREEAPNPVQRDISKKVGVILDKFPKSWGLGDGSEGLNLKRQGQAGILGIGT